MSHKRQEVLILPEHLGSSPVFGGIHVVHSFSFLCCVFSSVCLRPVSFVPNVASVSGLSIPDLPVRFSLTFIYKKKSKTNETQ